MVNRSRDSLTTPRHPLQDGSFSPSPIFEITSMVTTIFNVITAYKSQRNWDMVHWTGLQEDYSEENNLSFWSRSFVLYIIAISHIVTLDYAIHMQYKTSSTIHKHVTLNMNIFEHVVTNSIYLFCSNCSVFILMCYL